MNKRDLIDALSGRLGDKKSATEALNAVLETIQSAVASGDKVAITGFGVFEKSERPARTARNPATGAEIHVAATSVPKFRPGADFKALVNGEKPGAAEAGRQGDHRQEEVKAGSSARTARASTGGGTGVGFPVAAARRCLRAATAVAGAATAVRPAWPARS